MVGFLDEAALVGHEGAVLPLQARQAGGRQVLALGRSGGDADGARSGCDVLQRGQLTRCQEDKGFGMGRSMLEASQGTRGLEESSPGGERGRGALEKGAWTVNAGL